MKFHAIEGNRQRLDGGAMFGNAPKSLWEKWMEPDEKNRIPLATRALLLQNDEGKNILFETGIGAFFEPKLRDRYGVVETEHMLLKNLQAIGVPAEEIDAVILSHLHFDHAGGLLSSYDGTEPKLVFPKATFYVGKKNWENANRPHIRERASYVPIIQQKLKQSNRLKLIEGERDRELPFGVRFHYSEGHTRGLMISEIEGFNLFFVTDLVPGLPWVHLPITMGYDRSAEWVVDEKQKLFQMIVEKNSYLFFTHDPETVCARLDCDEKGKYRGLPISFGQ